MVAELLKVANILREKGKEQEAKDLIQKSAEWFANKDIPYSLSESGTIYPDEKLTIYSSSEGRIQFISSGRIFNLEEVSSGFRVSNDLITLTLRQIQILALRNKQLHRNVIAKEMGLAESTIRNHLVDIRQANEAFYKDDTNPVTIVNKVQRRAASYGLLTDSSVKQLKELSEGIKQK